MRLLDRLIKGSILNFIAVVFNQGSTLIVNIIVARILLKEVFGEYAIVLNTLQTVATISQLAIGYTASKYIAEFRTNNPVRTGRIMGICSIISYLMAGMGAILLIIFAPWLSISMLKAPHLSISLIIGSIFLFFSSVNGYQIGALSGLESYKSLAKAGIISGISSVIAISLGAFFGGLNGAVLGLGVSSIIRCFFHYIWLNRESKSHNIKSIYRGSFRQEKDIILKFALPAAIAGYYSTPMIWLTNSFLVQQPSGYAETGLFSAANNLRILVLFLPNVINNVSLSILNNEKSKKDRKHFNQVFITNVILIFCISLIGVLVFGFFGRSILRIFGKDFEAGHSILLYLVCSSLFESVCISLYQYIQSHSKMWLSFFSINVPRELFFVITAYFLVKSFGGEGLAMSYLGAAVLSVILHIILVIKINVNEKKELNKKNI